MNNIGHLRVTGASVLGEDTDIVSFSHPVNLEGFVTAELVVFFQYLEMPAVDSPGLQNIQEYRNNHCLVLCRVSGTDLQISFCSIDRYHHKHLAGVNFIIKG